jgi:hypothetical protein
LRTGRSLRLLVDNDTDAILAEGMTRNLFSPVITKDTHVAFERLAASRPHRAARALMNDAFAEMGDPDGNFVDDFQGPGFHSRMFELACFAYLREGGWEVDRRHNRPDFIAAKGSTTFAFESVTLNATRGRDADIAVGRITPLSEEAALEKAHEELAIRIRNAFVRKLQHAYWEESHIRGMPFILCVAPFHEPGSTNYVDEDLARYLFGAGRHVEWTEMQGVFRRETPVRRHRFEGREIVSDFFGSEPGAENISAVLWCNQFTIPKFFRIAAGTFGLPPGLRARVSGFYVRKAKFVEPYAYELDGPGVPSEGWSRGVSLLVNPRARIPLPSDALDCTSIFQLHGGRVARRACEFHPLTSFMHVYGDFAIPEHFEQLVRNDGSQRAR